VRTAGEVHVGEERLILKSQNIKFTTVCMCENDTLTFYAFRLDIAAFIPPKQMHR